MTALDRKTGYESYVWICAAYQELKNEQEAQNGWRLGSPGPGSDVDFTDEENNDKEPTLKDLIQSMSSSFVFALCILTQGLCRDIFSYYFSYQMFVYITGGQIPDASVIHAIRKRRQLEREQGGFIPLDDTVRADKVDKSRLVRYSIQFYRRHASVFIKIIESVVMKSWMVSLYL